MTEYEHFKGMLQSALKEMIADGTIKFDLNRSHGRHGPTIELSVEIDGQKTYYYPARLD